MKVLPKENVPYENSVPLMMQCKALTCMCKYMKRPEGGSTKANCVVDQHSLLILQPTKNTRKRKQV